MLKQLYCFSSKHSLIHILSFAAFTSSMLLNHESIFNPNLPSPNRSPERPFHANEITPDLPELTEHGKEIEKDLEHRVRTNRLSPTRVASERVRKTHYSHFRAEGDRNIQHISGLRLKKQIRKLNRTWLGRQYIKRKELKEQLEESRIEKSKARKALEDIAHDSAIHKKCKTFGDKDVQHINKTMLKGSKELGYHSDGRSNGSDFGYRSRSPSPHGTTPHEFFFGRPSRPTPSPRSSPSRKSSSSSDHLPSLSPTEVSSKSTSLPISPKGSTATSHRRTRCYCCLLLSIILYNTAFVPCTYCV